MNKKIIKLSSEKLNLRNKAHSDDQPLSEEIHKLLGEIFHYKPAKDTSAKDLLLWILQYVNKELDIAKEIQERYLPKPETYENNKFIKTFFIYKPMNKIGGDIINISKLKNGGLGVFIGDISGHGIPAALVSGIAYMTIRSADRYVPNNPLKYIKRIYKYLYRDIGLFSNQTITGGYCTFSPVKKGQVKFTWVRGGHPHPILVKKNSQKAEQIVSNGSIMGVRGNVKNIKFKEVTRTLNKGDRVFLYTDGIPEIIVNKEKNSLEESDQDWPQILSNFSELSIEQAIKQFYNSIKKKRYGAATDDITLAGFEIS